MNKKILISLFSFLIVTCSVSKMQAQVTIGSANDPAAGALLDLKQNADGTSSKGMMYPRVALTNKSDLTPMVTGATAADKTAHTGLVVFNITTDATFSPGLHIWSGTEWQKLTASPIIQPAISGLFQASSNPTAFTVGQPYTGLITIPYEDGNGGFFESSNIVVTCTDPNRGSLVFTPLAGQLAYGPGNIYIKVSGTQGAGITQAGQSIAVSVTFLGKSTTFDFGKDKIIKTIPYVRQTVSLPSGTPGSPTPVTGSETEIGNLMVRYVYAGTNGQASYIEFQPKFQTHCSYWFEKMGAGVGVPLPANGNNPLFTYGLITPASPGTWYDFESGSPTARTDTNLHKDLNPTTRDQGRATIVLQNDAGHREMYRITCNAYTTISTAPNANGAVALFIEWLE